jgi:hypothetical protein
LSAIHISSSFSFPTYFEVVISVIGEVDLDINHTIHTM